MLTATPTSHEDLAKDFLKLSPEALKAKYPQDREVQGALSQLALAKEMCKTYKTPAVDPAQVENEIMRRIALNLAQGLPILLPNMGEICSKHHENKP